MPLSAMGLEAVNMLRRKYSSGFQWQHTNIRTHKFMATKEAVAGETHLHSRTGVAVII